MRHLLEASLLVCALMFALPAAAQDEGPGVPVDQAAYHVPVFRNDYVALLRVNIPSQRSAGYHIHSADQISILIEEADQAVPTGRREAEEKRLAHRAADLALLDVAAAAVAARARQLGAEEVADQLIEAQHPRPIALRPSLRFARLGRPLGLGDLFAQVSCAGRRIRTSHVSAFQYLCSSVFICGYLIPGINRTSPTPFADRSSPARATYLRLATSPC